MWGRLGVLAGPSRRLMWPPPYAHWLNGEAEKAIQSAKRGTRTRLRALIKKVVGGKRIIKPSMYGRMHGSTIVSATHH